MGRRLTSDQAGDGQDENAWYSIRIWGKAGEVGHDCGQGP